jgi:hypothetical protein
MKPFCLVIGSCLGLLLATPSFAQQGKDDEKDLLKKILDRLEHVEKQLEGQKVRLWTNLPSAGNANPPLWDPNSHSFYYGGTNVLLGHLSNAMTGSGLVELGPDGKLTVRCNEIVDGKVVEERKYSADSVKEFKEKYPEVAKKYGIGERTLKFRLGEDPPAATSVVLQPTPAVVRPKKAVVEPTLRVVEEPQLPPGAPAAPADLGKDLKALRDALDAVDKRLKELEKKGSERR